MVDIAKLKELGMTRVASDIEKALEFKRKTMIAYERFRFVTPDKFVDFNTKLYNKTVKKPNKYSESYDKLIFTRIDQYTKVPPADVLLKLEEAQNVKLEDGSNVCVFDTYEIAHIQSIVERKDPILFGCITGCADKFFIAQWDDDVKIEDIINENEG